MDIVELGEKVRNTINIPSDEGKLIVLGRTCPTVNDDKAATLHY